MNHFTFTRIEGSEDPAKVEITLSEAAHDLIMEPIKARWLLPVLQGEREQLADGSVRYSFELPQGDAELLKEACLKVYTKISGYDTTN